MPPAKSGRDPYELPKDLGRPRRDRQDRWHLIANITAATALLVVLGMLIAYYVLAW